MIPGSWLIASVCIDLMKQSSFAIDPVWGISSLTQAPSWLLGYREKRKIEGATGKRFCPLVIVVRRWPCLIDSGRS